MRGLSPCRCPGRSQIDGMVAALTCHVPGHPLAGYQILISPQPQGVALVEDRGDREEVELPHGSRVIHRTPELVHEGFQ